MLFFFVPLRPILRSVRIRVRRARESINYLSW